MDFSNIFYILDKIQEMRNYYILGDDFTTIGRMLGSIIDEKPRFYLNRCFFNEISLYKLPNTDPTYGIPMLGALCSPKARAKYPKEAAQLQERMRVFEALDELVASIYEPRYMLGFVLNPTIGTVFMWEGADNFMPLLGNNTTLLACNTHDTLSDIMNRSVPKPMAELGMKWILHRVSTHEVWAQHRVFMLYAITEASSLPGAYGQLYSYYEDMPDTDHKWLDMVSEIGALVDTQYKLAKAIELEQQQKQAE